MIRVFVLVFVLAAPTFEQSIQSSTPRSPCPSVFTYEPPGAEPGRWYGVAQLSTDSTLHSLWLNIVLDGKADILGNWIGDVSTQDNMDFKIENTDMVLNPGPALGVRFFVQYNPLNKTPRLLAIRMNGREICSANSPHTNLGNSEDIRPTSTKRPQIGPEDIITRPVGGRPIEEVVNRPVFSRPSASPGPVNIGGGGEIPSQSVNRKPSFQATPAPSRNPSRQPDSSDDVSNGDDDNDYFTGIRPAIVIPIRGGTNPNSQNQCGRVMLNNPVPLIINGTPTFEGQWPWQIALYQTQTVDNKYICGGTLVSHRHVITAAHCVARKGSKRIVNKNTLTVYLGKHNLRTSVNGVQIKFVEKITVHPDYNASIYSRDIAILQLIDSVTYSDRVQAACLWPESQIDLSYIIGRKGSVVGWGFDDTGVATEELSLVEMPVVDTETCIRSYSDFFVKFTSDYTFCAGFRDGSSVCNGDSGGGMVFKNGNSWYLRGLVSLSVARQNEFRCDPSHYVIFTDVAKFMPWIKQNVNDF